VNSTIELNKDEGLVGVSRPSFLVPPTCNIGLGHANIGNAVFQSSLHPFNCTLRGIIDRPIRENYMLYNSSTKFDSTLDLLIELGYKSVVFIGDSVTIQLSHFLSCDLIRSGYISKKCGRFSVSSSERSKNGGCDIWESKTDPQKSITLNTQLSGFPCVYSNCTDPRETIENSLVGTANRIVKNKVRQLIVLNFGLHLHQKDFPFPDSYIEFFASGLLKAAKEAGKANSTLVFRETSSQHFSYTEDGLFAKETNLHYSKYCCVKKSPRSSYPTDDLLLNFLDDLDPNWRLKNSSLKWANFYEKSLQFHSLHAEFSLFRRGGVDCTHYIYVPGMSSLLTASIENSLMY